MFNEILLFKEVATFTDFSREKIIDRLNHLQERSQEFANHVETKKREQNDEQKQKNDEILIREKFKKAVNGEQPGWESKSISFQQAREITNEM